MEIKFITIVNLKKDGQVKYLFRTPEERAYTLNVSLNDATILDVKQIIAEKSGLPAFAIRLKFKDVELLDEVTLTNVGISRRIIFKYIFVTFESSLNLIIKELF